MAEIEIFLNFDEFEVNGKIGFEVLANSSFCTKDKLECPFCTKTINVKFSVVEEYLTEDTFSDFESVEPVETIVENENTDILKESILNELYELKNTISLSLETSSNDGLVNENVENIVPVIQVSDSDETCSTSSLLNIKYQKEIEDAIENLKIDTIDESSLISFIEENIEIENIQIDSNNEGLPEKCLPGEEYDTEDCRLNSNNEQTNPDSTNKITSEETNVQHTSKVIHICPCNRAYKLKKYFLKHMKQYHPDFSIKDCETLDSKSAENIEVLKSRDGRPIHRCNVCEKVYWSRRSYRRHMVCCHPDEAKRLNLQAKTHRCQYCDKIYFTSELLNQHLLLHVNPDHYKCGYCSKSFVTHNNLKRHINAVHLRIKSYICEVCGVRFNQRYSLRLHHQELHGTDGRYECNDCGKTYGSKDKLKCHIQLSHYGYGKTVCKLCGKTFLNNNYKRHLRDVHKEGEQFAFACRYCNKVFNRRSYQEIHETIHTGEKRYVCTICNERFQDPGYKYFHIRKFHPLAFEQRKKRFSHSKKIN
uniref:CSON011303 protein n=1 Tax=Culicoides sonorensis TaxID=179676 RepID=A0A336K4U8_CULSO